MREGFRTASARRKVTSSFASVDRAAPSSSRAHVAMDLVERKFVDVAVAEQPNETALRRALFQVHVQG
jgi:hypothetical protein